MTGTDNIAVGLRRKKKTLVIDTQFGVVRKTFSETEETEEIEELEVRAEGAGCLHPHLSLSVSLQSGNKTDHSQVIILPVLRLWRKT